MLVDARYTRLLAVGVMACFASLSRADDLERAQLYRPEVNGEIDVLVAAKATTSPRCVSALNDMHTTDEQLKALGDQAGNEDTDSAASASDQGNIAVARDVLASDMQVAADACRPEAELACANANTASLAKVCETLRRAIQKAPSPR
jgi:hypothetical protein